MKRMNLFQRIWHKFAGHDWEYVKIIRVEYVDTDESWNEVIDICKECGKFRRRKP